MFSTVLFRNDPTKQPLRLAYGAAFLFGLPAEALAKAG